MTTTRVRVLTPEQGAAHFGSRQDTGRSMKALAALTGTTQPAASTTKPTVTLANAQDAATPLWVKANNDPAVNAPNTAAFAFSRAVYAAAGGSSPYSYEVRQLPEPIAPSGYGSAVIDFISDAPVLSFLHQRAQSGLTRILVDGVEAVYCGNATTAGTAQAGAAATITLGTGANTATGYYLGQWVKIISGTGVGQYAQISAYNGSTKVASIAPAWTTVPDATSVYEITQFKMTHTNSTQSGYSAYFFKLDFAGERRMRRYHLELDGTSFRGIYTGSALDTIVAAQQPGSGTPTVWIGDSFSAGTGAGTGLLALSRVACDLLGWQLINKSIGGTGYLNPNGTGSLTIPMRALPSTNSWQFACRGATGGTFTVTQGTATTAAIASGASIAQIQAAFDAAFGTQAFLIVGDSAVPFFAIGQGATGALNSVMTFTSSLTGITQYYWARYTGQIAPHVPKDGAGNPLPFNIVLAGAHNDTTDSNAAYTTTALQSTVAALITALYAAFPTATIWVVGGMYIPGGSVPTSLTAADAAIQAACTATLKPINGFLPFISTLAAGILTGTGYPGNLKGDGNSDIAAYTDGVHPGSIAHQIYGTYLAQKILGMLRA